MRKRNFIFNISTSLSNQIITIFCGFIIPKLILDYYGSSINGLISSITQFLGFIAFLELGVGAVVQSTLYEPLANKDNREISRIVKSSDKFFKKIAIILIGYIIILAIGYPFMVISEFGYFYTMTLIIIISVSMFAQYYFGVTYQLLLNADQKSYITISTQMITTILNIVACCILIINGFSIHIVKLVTSLIFILRPLIMMWYVTNNYIIDNNIILEDEPIKQKWNGFAQHLSAAVLNNTDIVVLTLFSTLENISIYTVYNLVVNGIKQIIASLSTGTSALFGNMMAKKEKKLLLESFIKYEFTIHFFVTLLYTTTMILIIPFIKIYTKGINDVNYIVPNFAIILTISQAVYCLRLPYNTIILAAGHYKQTQTSALVEMSINIIISVLCVIRYGLIGVAIGTLIAMLYRTVYLVWYLKKNILFRKTGYFIKYLIVDILIVIISLYLTRYLNQEVYGYFQWIKLSIKTLVMVFLVSIFMYGTFYGNIISSYLKSNKYKNRRK